MAEKATKKHAEMAKQGWKFQDLDVYTEDGDMKGLFITYVREPAPAPSAAPYAADNALRFSTRRPAPPARASPG